MYKKVPIKYETDWGSLWAASPILVIYGGTTPVPTEICIPVFWGFKGGGYLLGYPRYQTGQIFEN